MTKNEIEERIQRALREKRQGATYVNAQYLSPTVEIQATTYFFPQSSNIVVASETSSLSKPVAETREQMRNEHSWWRELDSLLGYQQGA